MTTKNSVNSDNNQPDISIVMSCYNEEEIVGYTISQLINAFEKSGHRLELIAIDNGSWDQTGAIIKEWANRNPSVIYHRVEKNEGYGNGVLSGIPLCTAPWIGINLADLPVEAQEVVKLYEIAINSKSPRLFKVRRRFRMEGPVRRFVSTSYNVIVRLFFGDLGTIDINANPKILPRAYLQRMNLQSKDWFIDLELTIKAKRMGLRVFETNVFAQLNPGRTSTVKAATCWEFANNLFKFRFGKGKRMLLVQPFEETEDIVKPNLNTSDTSSSRTKDAPGTLY
ncbi:MAG: glycosyltransferase family 2 protein [Deltaproteobacteria bacterium]|nr:glycosyltransferase family 2 protein [Deltaproteobacteria bacterium]